MIKLELTQDEADTLALILCRVGGCPQTLSEHYAEINRPGIYDEIRRGEMPLREIDSATFEEFLNVLPPKGWEHADGVERFMVCEALCDTQWGTAYQMYARHQGRFYTKPVIAGECGTYITSARIGAA